MNPASTNQSVKSITKCCGCSACAAICPHSAIAMTEDECGFYRSFVNDDLCVNCGLCLSICPEREWVKESDPENIPNPNQRYFAARNTDPAIVEKSSSGGAFHSLAKAVLGDGGIVYGVKLDSDFMPIYCRISDMCDLSPLYGSKYVQAVMPPDIYPHLDRDIQSNKTILFSGTSCAICGIKNYLKKKNLSLESVVFIDVFCSGLLSRKIWHSELEQMAAILGVPLKQVSFRSKKRGWRDFSMEYTGENLSNGIIIEPYTLSNVGLFHEKSNARMSACTGCKYLSWNRVSDITLGDFWHEEYLPKKWHDDKGTSIVLTNTDKGYMLLKETSDLEIIEVERSAATSPRLDGSDVTFAEVDRASFWADYHALPYQEFAEKYCNLSSFSKFTLGIIRPLLIKSGLLRFMLRVRHLISRKNHPI